MGGILAFLAEFSGIFVGFGALIPGFFRPLKQEGLGAKIPVGTVEEIKQRFAQTNDEPILFAQGRFFLLHPPEGIIAAFRRCTHLGCTVPYNVPEDQFHCVCHGSLFDKKTATVKGGPAPRPLDLFAISADPGGQVIVDTKPLEPSLLKRTGYDAAQLEESGHIVKA